ncbi:MAG TPA: hypothetical protein VJU84_12635 [Pyrinomonadaceae bacterium]|nr:hypothetical protein [Pyrinomonadaceae bacterium]
MTSFLRLLVLVSGLTFTLFCAHTIEATVPQQHQRILVKKPWRQEPVKIIAVKTKRIANVEMGREFNASEDWLDGFSATVLNSHSKTVTVMTIEMVFRREPGDPRRPFAFPLHFGPRARSAQYVHRDRMKVIKPGETAILELTAEHYESLLGFLQVTDFMDVKRVELVVTEVGFEDGSMLYSGTWFLQDPAYPNDPTKKIRVRERPGAFNRTHRSSPVSDADGFFF